MAYLAIVLAQSIYQGPGGYDGNARTVLEDGLGSGGRHGRGLEEVPVHARRASGVHQAGAARQLQQDAQRGDARPSHELRRLRLHPHDHYGGERGMAE